MYCESCGSFIPDGQAFCSNCGSAAPQAASQPVTAEPAPVAQPVVAQPVVAQPVTQPVAVQPIYQQPVQPVYAQPVVIAAAPSAGAKPKNGSATTGLVMGILTLLFSWIPFLNFLTTTVMGLLGLIFSIIGIAKGKSGGRGKAIAGLILTLLGIIIFVVEYVILFSAASTELGDIDYDDIFSDIDFEDIYSTSYSDTDNNFVIDGSFVTPENDYFTGVLHIDGIRVDF